MDPELGTLVATAATTLVTALTTGAWDVAKKGVGALWRRVHPDRAETVEAELVEAREQLLAVRHTDDEQLLRDLVDEWQSRLRRLLATAPHLAGELRRLNDELQPVVSASSQIGQLGMQARVSGHGRVYQAGRDQHINEQ
ncbi:hypothetical protein [Actinophytocola xanthii]|uniref:Uncharacterized protein n=1 Tax=Actinophytocola xanthii TaxID=1912961 RepID=A0A1Q8CGI1_9PSEU|nr:hypothetical protein [Actinophytocola xanthii]OLF13475.1 hypothetical protein BU204_27145 [Actinophytocola xanthii]